MSETPRTDEAEANAIASGIPISMVCRQLERELNEARGCLHKAANVLEELSYGDKTILSVVTKWRKAAGLENDK